MAHEISFIISAYNIERYIERCIRSVAALSMPCDEIIVIDDGSTDSTGAIADALAAETENLRVCHKSNGGVSDARNFGIEQAAKEYIWFIDGDDYVTPDGRQAVEEALAQTPDLVTIGRTEMYKGVGRRRPALRECTYASGVEMFEAMVSDGTFRTTPWDKIFAAELIKKHKILFPKGYIYEDMIFCMMAMMLSERCITVPTYCYHYINDNAESITHSYSPKDEGALHSLQLAEEFMERSQCRLSPIYYSMLFNWISSSIFNKYAVVSLTDDSAKALYYRVAADPMVKKAAKECAHPSVRFRIRAFARLFRLSPALHRYTIAAALLSRRALHLILRSITKATS